MSRRAIQDQFTDALDQAGRRVSRQRRWQLRKMAGGLCLVCGKAAVGSARHCETHKLEEQIRLQRRYVPIQNHVAKPVSEPPKIDLRKRGKGKAKKVFGK